MKPVYVKTEIEIGCTVAEVAAFATSPDNAPEWYVNIKSVSWRTAKPLQVGSEIAFIANFLGRQLAYVYRIEEWVQDEKLVMRTADGPFPMQTTYLWKAGNNGKSIMTLINEGQPTGFGKIFRPFMAMAMKKANKKDLLLLKKILEEKKEA